MSTMYTTTENAPITPSTYICWFLLSNWLFLSETQVGNQATSILQLLNIHYKYLVPLWLPSGRRTRSCVTFRWPVTAQRLLFVCTRIEAMYRGLKLYAYNKYMYSTVALPSKSSWGFSSCTVMNLLECLPYMEVTHVTVGHCLATNQRSL